jgi:hypothetical protein
MLAADLDDGHISEAGALRRGRSATSDPAPDCSVING